MKISGTVTIAVTGDAVQVYTTGQLMVCHFFLLGKESNLAGLFVGGAAILNDGSDANPILGGGIGPGPGGWGPFPFNIIPLHEIYVNGTAGEVGFWHAFYH